MTPEFQKIIDMASGADGGVSFVMLRTLYEEMQRQAAEGSASAQEVVNIVHRFARLIDVAQKPPVKKA